MLGSSLLQASRHREMHPASGLRAPTSQTPLHHRQTDRQARPDASSSAQALENKGASGTRGLVPTRRQAAKVPAGFCRTQTDLEGREHRTEERAQLVSEEGGDTRGARLRLSSRRKHRDTAAGLLP